jgi:hypothetical protein
MSVQYLWVRTYLPMSLLPECRQRCRKRLSRNVVGFLPFPALWWRTPRVPKLRVNSPPFDSHMIPVGTLERQKAACAAF